MSNNQPAKTDIVSKPSRADILAQAAEIQREEQEARDLEARQRNAKAFANPHIELGLSDEDILPLFTRFMLKNALGEIASYLRDKAALKNGD